MKNSGFICHEAHVHRRLDNMFSYRQQISLYITSLACDSVIESHLVSFVTGFVVESQTGFHVYRVSSVTTGCDFSVRSHARFL